MTSKDRRLRFGEKKEAALPSEPSQEFDKDQIPKEKRTRRTKKTTPSASTSSTSISSMIKEKSNNSISTILSDSSDLKEGDETEEKKKKSRKSSKELKRSSSKDFPAAAEKEAKPKRKREKKTASADVGPEKSESLEDVLQPGIEQDEGSKEELGPSDSAQMTNQIKRKSDDDLTDPQELASPSGELIDDDQNPPEANGRGSPDSVDSIERAVRDVVVVQRKKSIEQKEQVRTRQVLSSIL